MTWNSSLTVQIVSAIRDIERAEWDRVFPNISESYGYFRALDETLSPQFKFFYILIREGSQILCVAPCFFVDYPLDTSIEGTLKKFLERLRQKFPQFLTLRVLVCGGTASEGRIGLHDLSRQDVAQILLKALQDLAQRENVRLIAFKDFPKTYTPFFAFFKQWGFHRVTSYPFVELDVPFRSFDEYLMSLSHITRKSLRRKFRKAQKLSALRMEVRSDLGEWLKPAYELYQNTLKKSEIQFERLTPEFFESLSRHCPKETKYFLWFQNEKLVAMNLCLFKDNVFVDKYIGLDYSCAYQYSLYYLTFRDLMTWCIEHGGRRYESGALNYDPKKHLGFRFVTHDIYVRHSHPVTNIFFGLLCWMLKPENFEPILKNLKKEMGHEEGHFNN